MTQAGCSTSTGLSTRHRTPSLAGVQACRSRQMRRTTIQQLRTHRWARYVQWPPSQAAIVHLLHC